MKAFVGLVGRIATIFPAVGELNIFGQERKSQSKIKVNRCRPPWFFTSLGSRIYIGLGKTALSEARRCMVGLQPSGWWWMPPTYFGKWWENFPILIGSPLWSLHVLLTVLLPLVGQWRQDWGFSWLGSPSEWSPRPRHWWCCKSRGDTMRCLFWYQLSWYRCLPCLNHRSHRCSGGWAPGAWSQPSWWDEPPSDTQVITSMIVLSETPLTYRPCPTLLMP